ncbi:hypothetical protein Tco_0671235 [Tanacetum coccineum]
MRKPVMFDVHTLKVNDWLLNYVTASRPDLMLCSTVLRLITWQCKKQTIWPTSTIEAEYVAAKQAAVAKSVYHSRQSIFAIGTTSYEMPYEKNSYRCHRCHTNDNVAETYNKAFDVADLNSWLFQWDDISISYIGPSKEYLQGWFDPPRDESMSCLTTKGMHTIGAVCARHITAKVAGKVVSISEASIRTDLIFDDADGIDSLPNQAIFDAIQLMGYEGDLTVLTFNKALFSPQWRNEDDMTLPNVYDLCISLCKQVIDQAKEIKLLKAQITKLKKQAKPKGDKRNRWDKQGIDEVRLSTEDVVSTDKEGVSTDFEKVSTDKPIVSTDGSKVSTDEQIEGTDEQVEGTEEIFESTEEQREEVANQASQTSSQTPTSMIFGDDETIATLLLNMSQAKAASKEKEKGVELKDVEEIDRPRPTTTRSLLTLKPLPKIDPKDKGKKKIEEEDESESEDDDIPQSFKKFKTASK